jgi:hypothetical protein
MVSIAVHSNHLTLPFPPLPPSGYRGVVIAPPMDPCLSLESTSTSVRTVQGTVTSEWAATSQGLKLGVTVPVGTVAKVVLDGGRFIDSMVRGARGGAKGSGAYSWNDGLSEGVRVRGSLGLCELECRRASDRFLVENSDLDACRLVGALCADGGGGREGRDQAARGGCDRGDRAR